MLQKSSWNGNAKLFTFNRDVHYKKDNYNQLIPYF